MSGKKMSEKKCLAKKLRIDSRVLAELTVMFNILRSLHILPHIFLPISANPTELATR